MIGDIIQCKLTSSKARLPFRGSTNSAGLDLFSAETLTINPMELKLISTDLQIKLPIGTYGHITTRSGLTLRHKLVIPTGTIDPDYRGIVKVVMMNTDTKKFVVNQGERIAQLICEKISIPKVRLCMGELDATHRSCSGFGSTGMK